MADFSVRIQFPVAWVPSLIVRRFALSTPSIFCTVDDKYIPLYRVMWISAVPHFCGAEDCEREGFYEVRLEQDESVWATREERDGVLKSVEEWQAGLEGDEPPPNGEWN